MVYKGGLLEPLALDYAKSLVFLFQSSALHLDHLEAERWANLVHMCFSVLLGRQVAGPSSPQKRHRSPGTPNELEDRPSKTFVTQVQIELANLLKTLMSSTSYPYMSTEYRHLVPALLKRFQSFFFSYSPDVSIQPQIFAALTTLLRSISFNFIQPVTDFGHAVWKHILALFASKHRHIKEDIIITMRLLLPFLTSTMTYIRQPGGNLVADNLRALSRRIQSEAENRTKNVLEPLSLEYIRLHHLGNGEACRVSADIFTGNQPLHGLCLNYRPIALSRYSSVVILHERRDCGSDTTPNSKSSKRMRYEHPILALMDAIKNAPTHTPPVHKLQHLLFLIERHWMKLELDVRKSIFDTVRDHICLDDVPSQPWAFLCVAAIAYASRSQHSNELGDWRAIWTNTIKRLGGHSRAACHAAYSILSCSHIGQPTVDCENIIKGLALHGPAYPFDSACSLLREYNWGIHYSVGQHKRDALHMDDILQLACMLCAFHRPNSLHYEPLLPSCSVVYASQEMIRAFAIRDYILDGVIREEPPPAHPFQGTAEGSLSKRYETPTLLSLKFSEFLERSLHSIHGDDGEAGLIAHDKLRRAIDISILALAFQASMRINGYRHVSRVLKAACDVLDQAHPHLVSKSTRTWSSAERTYVLGALDPMTLNANLWPSDDWNALTGLASTSGVGIEIYDPEAVSSANGLPRSDFPEGQTILWTESVVQACFTSIIESTADLCLRITTGNEALNAEDDFATHFSPTLTQDLAISSSARKMLQSSGLHPIRDDKLISILLDEVEFVPLAVFLPLLLEGIPRGHYILESTMLDELFDKMHDLLKDSSLSRNETLTLLLIEILRNTMSIWVDPIHLLTDIGCKARDFIFWIVMLLEGGKARSWKVRDQTLRLLEEYLRQDPSEAFWNTGDDRPTHGPSYWIWSLGTDLDVRVRFRSAVASSRLFVREGNNFLSAKALYESNTEKHAAHRDELEHILTCLLWMGNVMIVSAEIRRLPYQDLLLTSVREVRQYDEVLQSILKSVVGRLKISDLRKLSDTYIASSSLTFLEMSQDLTNIPPSLLGYGTRQSSTEGICLRCLPGGLLYRDSSAALNIGRFQLSSFCRVMRLEESYLLPQLFAPRVSMRICMEHDTSPGGRITTQQSDDMWNTFETWAADLVGDNISVWDANIDAIIFEIIRTVGEVDVSPGQSLYAAVDSIGFCNLDVFLNLTRFRETMDLTSANTVGTIYHVLQRLFDRIGESILVNDKIRCLNAMCLLVASKSDVVISSQVLLRRLLFGSSVIISQPSLANRARSIFHWASEHYALPQDSDGYRFMDCLVRVSRTSYDLSRSPSDSVRSVGSATFQWIEQLVIHLFSSSQSPSVKRQIITALTLWPTTLGRSLEALMPAHRSETLRKVLAKDGLACNQPGYDLTRFLTHDFWFLKSCIPEDVNIGEDGSKAFLDLIFSGGGRITRNPSLHLMSHSIGYRHQKEYKRASGTEGTRDDSYVSPHLAILLSLVDCLFGDHTRQIQLAYITLRRLLPQIKVGDWVSAKELEEASIIQYPRLKHVAKVDVPDFTVLETSLIAEASVFQRWIASVTQFFCNVLASADEFYCHFTLILSENTDFAAQLFPILIHEVLRETAKEGKSASSMREKISTFFNNILNESFTDTQTIRSIIDSCCPLAYEQWLDLDLLLLSKGAAACGSYTTALLILELRSESSPADSLVEHIMYDIYSHIEEPDGFYGIPSHNAEDFLIRRIEHEKQWTRALSFHGASFEARPVFALEPPDASAVVRALHCFGLDRVADVMRAAAPSEIGSVDLDLGWRTDNWDLPVRIHDGVDNASLYLSLKSIHRERDPQVSRSLVRRMIHHELHHLRDLKDEDYTEIESSVRRLLCIREVNNWLQGMSETFASSDHKIAFHQVPSTMRFADVEAIISTRLSLLRAGQRRERDSKEQIGNIPNPLSQSLINAEVACLLELSAAARDASLVQLALNSITQARSLDANSFIFEVAVEFAKVLWSAQERKIAVDYLMTIGDKYPDANLESRALLLAQIGEWISHASLKPPMHIRDTYFEPAHKLMDAMGSDHSRLASIPHRFASFAEHQYLAINRSDLSSQLKSYMIRKQQEIESLASVISSSQPDQRHLSLVSQAQRRAKVMFEQDSKQFSLHMEKMNLFLYDAIAMYSRCLVLSDEYDRDSVIHLCSLWFGNFEDDELNRYIEQAIDPIPSRKFIFFAHQLSARLSAPTGSSGTVQHPFHGLYQVYALLHNSPPPSGQPSSSLEAIVDSRTLAAEKIFNSLRNQPTVGPRLRDVERVCDAYVEWATFYLDKDNKKDRAGPIPSHIRLLELKNVNIPVPTLITPVDPSCAYDDESFVSIQGYAPTYNTAGGINLPKICECHGSDGSKHRQLFKGQGEDDLRQDAVMEQVFDLVNHVLTSDIETKRRSLRVRTYKVIPLTYRSGVMEFVPQTMPLSGWLIPAHKILSSAAGKLSAVRKAKPNNLANTLLKEFLKIRERFHPVLRHFFTESHKSPMAWFEMRLKYARSVATTSIVGHMMGIGDRHISNILLDRVSGEVVHIDFGIVFDQGRLLNIPETVPFRLTADIVDGLGMTKTEGVFRRCAEETLRVLRNGSEVILTILEVFKHDPLHSWTATPLKLKRIQGTPDTSDGVQSEPGFAEDSADRALHSVRSKLDKSLSVDYTVNELITMAIDPANLCMIFSGWNPHA
ncbi:uncharacterized protein EI90DRAFT_3084965 [Cantharellus anzutake]|uniref:uncharacterized protein n=1 Tax=Cantharellus anzutake TaxID=1750568 RepID=UPI0019042418|nr:uncharacterized protein EI90DRAFT_3084965 [Cantharellus anzutake]KAF8317780.1 hypothetical protein EI90DRAFT_3084965 [Cantharellus anzutake]